MNRLTEAKAKAIAVDYVTNGFDKVKTLLNLGYSVSYARSRGAKLVYDNALVRQEIQRLQGKNAVGNGVTLDEIVKNARAAVAIGLETKCASAITQGNDQLAKLIGAYRDNQFQGNSGLTLVFNTEQPKTKEIVSESKDERTDACLPAGTQE